MMQKLTQLSLVCSTILCIASCKKPAHHHLEYKERQTMTPASTSDEWLSRLKLDLENKESIYYRKNFSYQLSELPPLDQWLQLGNTLAANTKTRESYQKAYPNAKSLSQSLRRQDKERLKYHFLANLLLENKSESKTIYQQLILQEQNHSSMSKYKAENALANLLSLSEDHEASIAWFQKHIKIAKNSSSKYSESPREPWEKALASNDVDKGIDLLFKKIESVKISERAEFTSKLATIASLLNKPELGEKAMIMLEKQLIAHKKSSYSISLYDFDQGIDYLAVTNQWERLLKFCATIDSTKSKNDSSSTEISPLISYKLTALYQLKKFELFEKEIHSLLSYHKDSHSEFFSTLSKSVSSQPSIGALYVDILHAKEETELAYQFCSHLLARNQSQDQYYKRLIQLDSAAAEEFITSLRKYDPYEERPLIWQSEIALNKGKLEQATKLIEQAIALDPSDGDQGKYTRMHCYDVLARILKKQGDHERSAMFSEVVISIREGEAADDFLYAGLTQEAADRYTKALKHFNDAYCLQSRLAKTLMEAGRFEEAIPHFEKAFELMPVSFGPRESHCFGCEGLFDDQRVQNLALPILEAFLKKQPNNPRTPYLLGLLFLEMKKETEALTSFKKAIELDPQYYNAATKLYKILSKNPASFKQAQELKKQIFEIAPYHSKIDYIPEPHKLKAYYKLAHNFPPSPIALTPLKELGFSTSLLNTKQFKTYSLEHSSSYSYISSQTKAIDGWSAKEVLENNPFFEYIF